MNDSNVLLTGVPRSGTTLACELLNRLPETVALDEPMEMSSLADPPDPRIVCDRIERFLAETRDSITTRKVAVSNQWRGRVVGSKVADDSGAGPRTELSDRQEIRIDKPLSADFLLVTKHPAPFTALLEALIERFDVYAIVRNPLSLLSSWQTVPFPVSRGHVTAVAERLDPGLRAALARIEDRVDRQFYLLGWFFEKYLTTLPDDRVIRYESMIASGGRVLEAITEKAATLHESLESRNRAPVYDRETMQLLGKRLLSSEGPYWHFYSKDSVRELLS